MKGRGGGREGDDFSWSTNNRSFMKHSFFNWRVEIDLPVKFQPNQLKNVEVRKFRSKTILVGWAGR